MKNFLNKQREIIALLAYAAVIASLVYLVILPLLDRIRNTNDQIQQEAMKQESMKLHVEQLPKIQNQYETVVNNPDLASALLDRNKAVVLIEKLEKLAENTKNEITITVQENASVKKTSTKVAVSAAEALVADLPSSDYLQIKINLTGSYDSIVEFVARLERFEYYSDIVAIQISKEDEVAASVSNNSNNGMFGQSAVGSGEKVPVPSRSDALTASLDTVFYTN